MRVIWRRKSPRFCPISRMASTAMLLQSPGKARKRKGDHGKRLLPLLELGPLHRVEADDAEKQRPHHAGLVEYAGFERDKGNAEGKIVGKVPDDGEKSATVLRTFFRLRV